MLPDADVIVKPMVPGSTFGSRALAGVGVAFYVMAAVRREIEARGTVVMPPVTDFLDLVALGTVADLVPLDVNNRVLVAQGIRRIRAGRAVPGIRALVEIGKRSVSTLTAADLGFTIGPRLNAREGSMTCRSVSAAAAESEPKRWRWPRASMRSTSSAARSRRVCGRCAGGGSSLRAPELDGPARHGVACSMRIGTRASWGSSRVASRTVCDAR